MTTLENFEGYMVFIYTSPLDKKVGVSYNNHMYQLSYRYINKDIKHINKQVKYINKYVKYTNTYLNKTYTFT